MNWYKVSKRVNTNEEGGPCSYDLTLNEISTQFSNHGLGSTTAFKQEIHPRLNAIIPDKKLVTQFGIDWKYYWDQVNKRMWPKLSRCEDEFALTFLKGDWDAIAKYMVKNLDKFTKNVNIKRNRKWVYRSKKGETPSAVYDKFKNKLVKGAMMSKTFFTHSIQQDNPRGVKKRFENGEDERAFDIVLNNYIANNSRSIARRKNLKKDQIERLFIDLAAHNEFIRNNMTPQQFNHLLTKEWIRKSGRDVQSVIIDEVNKGSVDLAAVVLESYLRRLPRIAYPAIYREYVVPVVPMWNYRSFYFIAINRPEIKRAIANNDIATIQQFVEEYRQKFEEKGDSFYKNYPPERRSTNLKPYPLSDSVE